ncbi:MAG TPA: prepilin-type N-terminal cleavage/methylation domain-containing protein [Candidatus Sumerlaeota bacterium]|nr:prepilin-type N-terminal cleavage/methylation domain-containing protein [Candidatus Sumerlaeota bacterium]
MKTARDMTAHTRRGEGAFTLLEVLLAVSIFAVLASALYSTFRVGVRSYELGRHEVDRMQYARVIFDTMSRDFRSIYYRNESDYNRTARNILSRYQQEWQQAVFDGSFDDFIRSFSSTSDSSEEEDARPNPYEMFLEIDLAVKAQNGEQGDNLSFVRYQYDDGITRTQPWALGRIKYSVEDGVLYRSEEDIIEPLKDLEGNPLEEKIPKKEALAREVVSFDLRFGFFHGEEWMEAEDWDSGARRYRNPAEDLALEFGDENGVISDPADPEYLERLKMEERKPPDGLPAFVRVTVEINDERKPPRDLPEGESRKPGRTRIFSSLVRIPSAQENYMPSLFEEEE